MKRRYTRICSRCGGSGVDPEIANCLCDCCEQGIETLELTEAEALEYPGVELVTPSQGTSNE